MISFYPESNGGPSKGFQQEEYGQICIFRRSLGWKMEQRGPAGKTAYNEEASVESLMMTVTRAQ